MHSPRLLRQPDVRRQVAGLLVKLAQHGGQLLEQTQVVEALGR